MDGQENNKDKGVGTKAFNGVKIFSATVAQNRETLGDRVMAWLRSDPSREVIDTVVTQSSDEAFHCIAITIFYWQPQGEARVAG
jgi:hypothetical protein